MTYTSVETAQHEVLNFGKGNVLYLEQTTETYMFGTFPDNSNSPRSESLCILLDSFVYFIQGKWFPDTSGHLHIFPSSPLDTSALGHSGYFQLLVIRRGTHQCNTKYLRTIVWC